MSVQTSRRLDLTAFMTHAGIENIRVEGADADSDDEKLISSPDTADDALQAALDTYVYVPTPASLPVLVDPQALAGAADAVRSATTVAGLRSAVLGALSLLDPNG